MLVFSFFFTSDRFFDLEVILNTSLFLLAFGGQLDLWWYSGLNTDLMS